MSGSAGEARRPGRAETRSSQRGDSGGQGSRATAADGGADPRRLVEEVEAALAALDALPAPERERALDAIQALLGLYADGFRRVLERLARPDSTVGPNDIAVDELVGHLLMIHDLHPAGFRHAEDVPGAPGGPPLVRLESGGGGRP